MEVDETESPTKFVIEHGQIIYPEERFRPENHKPCNKAIISFREWRANVEKTGRNITAADIPKEYIDLIAVLAHESVEPLDSLIARLNDLLSPFERDNEACLFFSKLIKEILRVTILQERYGLADSVTLTAGSPSSVPKRLTFCRWEVLDSSMLPNDIYRVSKQRKDKRKNFSALLTHTFEKLSVDERRTIFNDPQRNFVLRINPSKPNAVQDDNRLFENDFFSSIKNDEYTTVAPYISQRRTRLSSGFDAVLHIGSTRPASDLKSIFLSELPSKSKKKRGIRYIEKQPLNLMNLLCSKNRTQNEELVLKYLRLKLLYFYENVRPAYYGTWTRAFTETVITGTRPFAKNTKMLNYDEDSEAEWDHDVDTDDVDILGFNSDSDLYMMSSGDEEDEPFNFEEKEEEETTTEQEAPQWVVPEGYLSEDEGIHVRRRKRTNHGVISRPARWPMTSNKHYPMKPVIIGPSFETANEPENHPLSDFKAHFLHTYTSHMNPFDELLPEDNENQPVFISVEPTNEFRPPMYQREVDKIIDSTKQELIQIIMENQTKTMMQLVGLLKSNKKFIGFTTAQKLAMIHDLAVQEMRDSKTEYKWYLRT